MDAQIVPAGWREWHPEETHYLPTAFLAEYQSSGPGADHAQREPHAVQLTTQQAQTFSPEVFLRGGDDWNPVGVLQRRRADEASPVAPAGSSTLSNH